MNILYFYGFASSPMSNKAQFFKEKFKSCKDVNFEIVDLVPDQSAFTNMRPSILIKKIDDLVTTKTNDKLILFGSSFGGFLATWYSSITTKKIERLVLLAPALKFNATTLSTISGTSLEHWEKVGQVPFFHYKYNKEVFLKYTFIDDLINNPPPDLITNAPQVPTLIIHGSNDDVVPPEWSKEYAENNEKYVELQIIKSDHQLSDGKEIMWKIIKKFLFELEL